MDPAKKSNPEIPVTSSIFIMLHQINYLNAGKLKIEKSSK